jgi:cytochrome c oxidase cbb3-type subunit III
LVLSIVAIFLLFPIYITGKSFVLAAKDYLSKKPSSSDNARKLSIFILLFCVSQFVNAQPATASVVNESTDWISWVLISVIVLEVMLIVSFSKQTIVFLKKATFSETSPILEKVAAEPIPKGWFQTMWEKMNRFKPASEEANIDTGHDYDGIRELDNITPPWFTATFIFTIFVAIVYMFRYHVMHSAPLQIEEYTISIAEAEAESAKFLALQSNRVDENSITLLGPSDVSSGKTIFIEKCSPCHESHAGSKLGGVGPNLTDEYWLHGGSLSDVFKTIKYGWPEKGMISWKDQLSAKQMAQITSFIMSVKGTNPPGAKEPQGDVYKKEKISATTTGKDSIPSLKDTTLTVLN